MSDPPTSAVGSYSITLNFFLGFWKDTSLWIGDGSHLFSVHSEPFNNTLISVANLKIEMLKELIFNLSVLYAH